MLIKIRFLGRKEPSLGCGTVQCSTCMATCHESVMTDQIISRTVWQTLNDMDSHRSVLLQNVENTAFSPPLLLLYSCDIFHLSFSVPLASLSSCVLRSLTDEHRERSGYVAKGSPRLLHSDRSVGHRVVTCFDFVWWVLLSSLGLTRLIGLTDYYSEVLTLDRSKPSACMDSSITSSLVL